MRHYHPAVSSSPRGVFVVPTKEGPVNHANASTFSVTNASLSSHRVFIASPRFCRPDEGGTCYPRNCLDLQHDERVFVIPPRLCRPSASLSSRRRRDLLNRASASIFNITNAFL